MGNNNSNESSSLTNLRETQPLNRLSFYQHKSGAWQNVERTKKPMDANSNHSNIFSLLTLNVWFSSFFAEERAQGTIDEIAFHNPTIVCLQEVKPSFINFLKENTFIQKNYLISDISGKTVIPYGVAILARIDANIHQTYALAEYELTTRMSRKVLLLDFQWPYSKHMISVATVHLESLNNAPTRQKQLREIYKLISPKATSIPVDGAIVCGDFNFDATRNYIKDSGQPLENDLLSKELLPDYMDVYAALHKNEPIKDTWTFDTTTNPNLFGHREETMRYDRIMLSPTKTVQPKMVAICANNPIKDEKGKEIQTKRDVRAVFPSDHYGLIAEFELAEKSVEQDDK